MNYVEEIGCTVHKQSCLVTYDASVYWSRAFLPSQPSSPRDVRNDKPRTINF